MERKKEMLLYDKGTENVIIKLEEGEATRRRGEG